MGASFDKLKAMLDEKGALTPEDVEKITKENGEMSPQEAMELESLKIKKSKESRSVPTMEEYIKASKILDETAEGSEEYKKAEEIVNAFEAGG